MGGTVGTVSLRKEDDIRSRPNCRTALLRRSILTFERFAATTCPLDQILYFFFLISPDAHFLLYPEGKCEAGPRSALNSLSIFLNT